MREPAIRSPRRNPFLLPEDDDSLSVTSRRRATARRAPTGTPPAEPQATPRPAPGRQSRSWQGLGFVFGSAVAMPAGVLLIWLSGTALFDAADYPVLEPIGALRSNGLVSAAPPRHSVLNNRTMELAVPTALDDPPLPLPVHVPRIRVPEGIPPAPKAPIQIASIPAPLIMAMPGPPTLVSVPPAATVVASAMAPAARAQPASYSRSATPVTLLDARCRSILLRAQLAQPTPQEIARLRSGCRN